MREPLGQQFDIEAMAGSNDAGALLAGRQQVNEQGRQPYVVQRPRHKSISRAVAAASAAMREQDYPLNGVRQRQTAIDLSRWNRDSNGALRESGCSHDAN